ncbi:putative protein OS=Streptomyces tendae OX=1932 GN=GUR47_14240 PE=4 SV=1 [Streptomyces tendae]
MPPGPRTQRSGGLLLAVELVFDRPLALGETQPFRYRITDGTGGENTWEWD